MASTQQEDYIRRFIFQKVQIDFFVEYNDSSQPPLGPSIKAHVSPHPCPLDFVEDVSSKVIKVIKHENSGWYAKIPNQEITF